MALTWQDEDIRHFFGCESPSVWEAPPTKEMFVVNYSGKLLNYSILFLITDEYVMISGNDTAPFGGDSLYEIAVPCDSVLVPDAPNQTGLAFWYGDQKQKLNLTLMLLKRPDGDLNVWPSTVWPSRHPYQQNLLRSDPSANNRYNLRTKD